MDNQLKIERVICHKTSDGKLFEYTSYEEAALHESTLRHIEKVRNFISEHVYLGRSADVDVDSVMKDITDNWEEFTKL